MKRWQENLGGLAIVLCLLVSWDDALAQEFTTQQIGEEAVTMLACAMAYVYAAAETPPDSEARESLLKRKSAVKAYSDKLFDHINTPLSDRIKFRLELQKRLDVEPLNFKTRLYCDQMSNEMI